MTDQDDDIISIFASHLHGVARAHSKIDYSTVEWKQLYDSINFIIDMEKELYDWSKSAANYPAKPEIIKSMYASIDEAE